MPFVRTECSIRACSPTTSYCGARLADAAKVGDWKTEFELFDDPTERVDVNWWRPGGTAWFTVLHQAAWPGAPLEVVGGSSGGGSAIGDRLRGAHPAPFGGQAAQMSLTKGVAVQGSEIRPHSPALCGPPPSPSVSGNASSLNDTSPM